MKKSTLRKLMCLLLAVCMLATMAACGSKENGEKAPTADNGGAQAEAPAEKQKITFWYLWSGDAAENLEKVIADYNAQSDSYYVEGLSVGDSQKIIAAMAAGNGPDITDDFLGNLGKYAAAGIMEPLDSYIEKTNYDIDDFVPAAVDACRVNGQLYAMPLNINFMGLYYNKTLLAEAGYKEPPKTLEELYEMAVATTKVNEDGTLVTCGFPDFPTVYYLDSFVPAAGGFWYTEDGTPAPADSEGNALALKLIRDYREEFGVDNVIQFSAGGKYLDPTDPFLTGNQTFRIDGPWLGKDIVETFQADIDYGVTFVPYPEAHPEYAGRSNVGCSIFFISSQSKVKDGAWDFMMYLVGKQGQLDFTVANGDFPSRLSVMEEESFKKGYDVDFYTQLANSENLIYTPAGEKNGEYATVISEQTELAMNLSQDIETTLKNIYEQGSKIYK